MGRLRGRDAQRGALRELDGFGPRVLGAGHYATCHSVGGSYWVEEQKPQQVEGQTGQKDRGSEASRKGRVGFQDAHSQSARTSRCMSAFQATMTRL